MTLLWMQLSKKSLTTNMNKPFFITNRSEVKNISLQNMMRKRSWKWNTRKVAQKGF